MGYVLILYIPGHRYSLYYWLRVRVDSLSKIQKYWSGQGVRTVTLLVVTDCQGLPVHARGTAY